MADNASLFSDTTTLFEVPAVSYDPDAPEAEQADRNLRRLPGSEVFVTVSSAYLSHPPDPTRFSRAGFPAVYDRTKNPKALQSGRKLGLFKKKPVTLSRRLTVQVPRAALRPMDGDVEAAQAVSKSRVRSHKTATLFETLGTEFVGVRVRKLLGQALAVQVKRDDVKDIVLEYPSESIIDAPASSYGPGGSSASVGARYVSLTITSPATSATASPANDSSKPLKVMDDSFDRFTPTAEAEATLDRVLAHLERRGGIWTHAAHNARPTFRNPQPKERPSFLVLGLFPKPFLDRCKGFHDQDAKAMPPDLGINRQHQQAPFTISPAGIAHDSASVGKDELEGFSVRVTREPSRSGEIAKFGGFVGGGGYYGIAAGAIG